ncbi:hypothetical protein BO78DRAFT_95302 [Aspergillus sclerotiicarbonarius CBS 121057]|uniref:Uncharacterized protein n=1 Tax=Aspergillus sclerotiicarbonarius (strain CBS 121057 / IBT 28362) TaxID=1448318 RepID=A0A319EKX1_ASPSB|nr:hypothetical protein BO78DRAFT_95302 [Aspergillus sclerotiicarbonarius CBS 121057]
MYPQTPIGYSGPMVFGHGGPNPGDGIDEYYAMQPQWTGIDTSPYASVSHPYTTAATFPSGAILTPISLPDSTFRPSPVLSHHSQEFHYSVPESVPSHGLGITAPFPSMFPRTVTAGLGHASEEPEFHFSEATLSPQPPPAKRVRRGPKQVITPREAPVTILPNPEGLQRMEQERRQGTVENSQRPRAPGRGRRDPQAEEEDAFVERLREQNLAWKVIREMFREKFHKDASEARLQMRMLRRRKERLARWDEHDVSTCAKAVANCQLINDQVIQIRLLMRAREYWEEEKYNVIAQKMKEFGAGPYTAQQCEAQLRYLDAQKRDRSTVPRARISEAQQARKRSWSKAAASSMMAVGSST